MRRTTSLLCLGVTVLLAASARAAEPVQLLPATPMVLKDGRIARLTAYAVPVPPGAVMPDAGTALRLDHLIDGFATDCFLTAQAIGHAEATPGETDPLASHRLARDRADHLRSRLLARGLPEASVASVWDWQHGLRDARVTLWVFGLLAGEDCEGTALPGPRPPALPPERLEARRIAMLAGPPNPPPAAGPPPVADRPAAAEGAAAPRRATAKVGTPTALRAPEPPRPPKGPVAAESAFPAAAAGPPAATAAPDEPLPPLAPQVVAGPGGLTIIFDADSSYLPNVAAREVRQLADRLESGRRYEVELEGTVAPSTTSGDAAPGQPSYGRWIAERRMSRIEELVRRTSNAVEVSFRQGFVEGDASRRVTLRLRALP